MADFLTPQDFEELLALGAQNQQGGDQMKQMLAQADALRGMGGAQPQMRDAGRYKVAANPLEFLGGLAMQYGAKRKSDQASDIGKQQGLNTQRQNAIMLRGLLGKPQQPPAYDFNDTGATGFQTFPVQ